MVCFTFQKTRIFNIAELGLLAGQWRTDRWTTGGISDAVVYLNYLEEIYEDTVNTLIKAREEDKVNTESREDGPTHGEIQPRRIFK